MPGTLFALPKVIAFDQGVAQGGATLTFSQTGTSTPQAVYTDVGLTVAHDDPVEADAEGVFAPIYLNPNGPDYRVVFRDSAGVTVYTVDNVPAGIGGTQNLTLESTAPYLLLTETDASTNEKNWRLIASGDQLLLQAGNDALDTWATFGTFSRTGTTVDSLILTPTTFQVGGNTVADIVTGSFTGTLTGGTTSPTGTVYYRKVGNIVSLNYFGSSWAMTSNATTMTMTGLPSALRTTNADGAIIPCLVYDNGAYAIGFAAPINDGTISFGKAGDIAGFTSSGSKGVPEGWSITYPVGLG